MPKVNRMMDGAAFRYAALAVAIAFVLGLVAGCPTVTPTPNDNTGGDQNMNDDTGDDENMNDDTGGGGDATAGATIYADNGCGICHGDNGEGGDIGPSLVGEEADDLTNELQVEEDHTGGQFPDLSAQDLADLAAFLAG